MLGDRIAMPSVLLLEHTCNHRVRFMSTYSQDFTCIRLGSMRPAINLKSARRAKTDPPGGGSRAGRIDRRQGIGGGSADLWF